MRSHCEERGIFLTRHCEERSDEAISYYKHVEIATLPPVARNQTVSQFKNMKKFEYEKV